MTESAPSRNLPQTQTLPPAAAALTVPYQAAMMVRREGQPTTDLAVLLRKRLRFVAFLVAAAMAVMLSTVLWSPGIPWQATTIYCIIFPGAAALAGILWRKPLLSVRKLRLIELPLFGMVIGFWTFVQAFFYPTFRLNNPPIWFGSVLAHAISLPWVCIILLYGIFIPNTWRRCAVVVGTAALIPLLICLSTGFPADATRGHGAEQFWVPLIVWLTLASALAIYGSHRIEVLRVEASQARRLGQYQLKQRLGSGGMGDVYLAEHVLLRRPCAIKLIRPERAGDPAILRRFEREVQATATLTHPNTVQVFDYGHSEDGTFYYAMEYLPGLNLEQFVQGHGPLPPERAIHFLRQVCGALREAHAVGLVHRDLKPSNIIICERGGCPDVAKLLDFGLVRSHGPGSNADNVTQEGTIAGTPTYMSPEQADGQSDLDAGSDIYSLGAVAYYLLTGQPPFVRPTPLQTLIAHLQEPPAPLDKLRADVPADLQAIVLQCLEKDPARRFADAQSLERALTRCQDAGLWSEDRAVVWWQTAQGRLPG